MLEKGSKEYKKRLKEFYKTIENTEEEWKQVYVDGELTKYYISNLGNIYNEKSKKVRWRKYEQNRYAEITLHHNGKKIVAMLHRLVALYFCEVPKQLINQGYTYDDLVVNHLNGIKSCDASFNLEWTTQYENMQHAFKTGLCSQIYGENCHLSKITNKEAEKVCKLIMKGKSNKEISEKLDITEKTIQHIRSGETWKAISEKYDFPKLVDSVPYTKDEEVIHKICKLLVEHKYSDVEIANKCEVKREYVKDIRTKRRRRDISDQYDFDTSKVEKITKEDIEKVCQLLEEKNLSQGKIAKEVGICQTLVSEIYNKKKYTEISKNYSF